MGPSARPALHSRGLPTVTAPPPTPPKAGEQSYSGEDAGDNECSSRSNRQKRSNGKGMKANSFAWTLQRLITNTLGRLPHLSRKTLSKHTREAARSLWVWSP